MALLLVPLVSLTALWAFATVITGTEAARLFAFADVMKKVGFPADDMVRALQDERRQTLVLLADPRRADARDALHARQRATDGVRTTFLRVARGARDEMSAAAAARFDRIEKGLGGLDGIRHKVEEGTLHRAGAFDAYSELVEPHYAFIAGLGALKADVDKQGRALVGIARAREALSREDALLAGALAAGTMTREDLRAFSDRVAERRILYSTNLSLLPTADQKIYEDYWRGTGTRELRIAEDSVILAGAGRAPHAVHPGKWRSAADAVLGDLARMGTEAGERYNERVRPEAIEILVKAAVAGVLGLAALVCSYVISLRIGRGLVRDLRQLRKEAHEVSGVRLPGVLRRLAAGERIDLEAEAPRLDYGPDELGQVGKALNTLQRAAVEAAVKQADVRRGVSDVFVNLARRSQVLLHRQLTLLDTMERRTEDTEELADLFRLDHLTTRMRRHAEGLVILSGASPARQWRKPIQLMDVVRAAAGEVEDYKRIEVRRLPRLAVQGPVVADLTHLLAELLENATVFSPPHTVVQVTGERVANGFTLEVHDRGLGMTAEAMLEANLRLAETPEFELSDTDRLGLFVVSRLAQRHGVRVTLQPSPYGGTTAVVLIPLDRLTETAPDRDTVALTQKPAPARLRTDLDAPDPERWSLFDDLAEPALPFCPSGREDGEQHRQADDDVPLLPRRRTTAPTAGRERPAEDERTPTGGLPRRVRQASLVPQLRDDPAARRGHPAPAAPDTARPEPDRDADEVRARMAALQRGWQRGREENEADPTRTTAPGTTSEGDGP
ncbi:nitrate- and nitrite sensing domain-containing protein [Streptomyces stramineus]|uniref:histidine kinase n=1 Tax=Streptomyces stramineus TaxID=173861 RepID=A0ABN1B6C5_9ACTN